MCRLACGRLVSRSDGVRGACSRRHRRPAGVYQTEQLEFGGLTIPVAEPGPLKELIRCPRQLAMNGRIVPGELAME
jgi:hypothetical protein